MQPVYIVMICAAALFALLLLAYFKHAENGLYVRMSIISCLLGYR